MATETRDSDRALAGRTHRRAFPSAKRAASLFQHSAWTEYDRRKNGSPVLRYLSHAQPWVVEAFLAVIKAKNDLKDWDRTRLEEREKLIDAEVARAYAETVRLTHTPDVSLADKVEADQVLMELLAERAALRGEIEKHKQRTRGH